jgi:protein-S-isoprenylcysteine O-methyltransferase Ste14
MTNLDTRAFTGLAFLTLITAVLVFLPAGKLILWQAWAFLAVYCVSALAITLYLMRYDRALLERRIHSGPAAEKRADQKIIMAFASAGFLGLLAIPGLDRRFGWSHMPAALVLAGDALVLIRWLGIFSVFCENTYGSATIELAVDQKVISRGPYALVRHPMYACGLVMLAGFPIALGSWWGLLALAALLPAILSRLLKEEEFLAWNLPGYVADQAKTPYRLIPLIW